MSQNNNLKHEDSDSNSQHQNSNIPGKELLSFSNFKDDIQINGMAFGVDPRRKQTYSLRQSRYWEIANYINELAKKSNRPIKVLDVGYSSGVLLRYLEVKSHFKFIRLFGVDLPHQGSIYKKDCWEHLYTGDLLEGMPEIQDTFDCVVCEQVLEHISGDSSVPLQTLERLLKPGASLIVGVPIFPHGLHLYRYYIIPITDKVFNVKKIRGHVQAFSGYTFRKRIKKHTSLTINNSKGFRIISGGILKPLENIRWWWRFNRFIGSIAPDICIEIQVYCQKDEKTS